MKIDTSDQSCSYPLPQRTKCYHDVQREHIMDQENHMVDPSTIDEVSEIMNNATDKLIEKELSNGL